MSQRGFTLIELTIVVAVIGLLAAVVIPNYIKFTGYAKEAAVKENCHVVQAAAEDFAIQNGGVYASDIDTDTATSGVTMMDLMPKGIALDNPFTKAATEPVTGLAASPGETGYTPYVGATGVREGYSITGYGKANQVIELNSGQ